MLHAAREPRAILEQMRRSQGSLTFSAQYQQAPVPPEGNIVKREWLRSYTTLPSRFDLIIASWDTASTLSETADYSVGTVWGAKGLDFYLLDIVRGRFEVPELRREVLRLSQAWKADQTIIEATDIGRAITQDLRRSGEYSAILRKPRFDKEARFLAQSARFESGQVHVPQEAPWLAGWLDELLAFPNGRHDDQVDSRPARPWTISPHGPIRRMRPRHRARDLRECDGPPDSNGPPALRGSNLYRAGGQRDAVADAIKLLTMSVSQRPREATRASDRCPRSPLGARRRSRLARHGCPVLVATLDRLSCDAAAFIAGLVAQRAPSMVGPGMARTPIHPCCICMRPSPRKNAT